MSGGNKQGQKLSPEEQEKIDMAIAIADSQQTENERMMHLSQESKLLDDYNRGMMKLQEDRKTRDDLRARTTANAKAAGGPLGASSAAKNKSSPAVGGAAGGSSVRNNNDANRALALAAAIDRANSAAARGFSNKKGKDKEKPL
jgi:hypothetical protein